MTLRPCPFPCILHAAAVPQRVGHQLRMGERWCWAWCRNHWGTGASLANRPGRWNCHLCMTMTSGCRTGSGAEGWGWTAGSWAAAIWCQQGWAGLPRCWARGTVLSPVCAAGGIVGAIAWRWFADRHFQVFLLVISGVLCVKGHCHFHRAHKVLLGRWVWTFFDWRSGFLLGQQSWFLLGIRGFGPFRGRQVNAWHQLFRRWNADYRGCTGTAGISGISSVDGKDHSHVPIRQTGLADGWEEVLSLTGCGWVNQTWRNEKLTSVGYP